MQVEVSRFNPHWVVALPETTTHEGVQSQKQGISPSIFGISSISSGQPANDPKAELGKIKEMLDSQLITQQDYEKKKDEILAKM
jgi:hypothetical protein